MGEHRHRGSRRKSKLDKVAAASKDRKKTRLDINRNEEEEKCEDVLLEMPVISKVS